MTPLSRWCIPLHEPWVGLLLLTALLELVADALVTHGLEQDLLKPVVVSVYL